jgi:multidrug efflux system membrane fusion protein
MNQTPFKRFSPLRLGMAGAGAVLIAAFLLWSQQKPVSALPAPQANAGVAVETARVSRADVPVTLEGLGTAQGFYTVTVSSRVDGALEKVGFVEGQRVKKGDLLARIDPRPYQAAYDQAVATKAKDEAQLANAKRDLARYVQLAPDNLASAQTVEGQKALVDQLQAQIAGDAAAVDNAKTQLDYATIASPIDGVTGIRLVDPGNIVHGANSTGIVVVTQIQPIAVLFTLPEEDYGKIAAALQDGEVTVAAMGRGGEGELDRGKIAVLDNQIDQATGTIRIKAIFPNASTKLWPGAYVNARVLLATRHNALTVPTAALQRGPAGPFVYVVKPDSSVEMRRVKIANDTGPLIVVEDGLTEGELVTTNNEYRLQPGAKVRLAAANPGGADFAGTKP